MSEDKYCSECCDYTEHIRGACEVCYRRDNKKFKPGDTLIFDPTSFNPDYWNGMTLDQQKRYYGDLYNFENPEKPFLFTFICEHFPQHGHCVLVNMDNQKVETMRHISDFRLVKDNEC